MIVCPKCGAPLNDGSAFCKNCGYSFAGGAQQNNFAQNQGMPNMAQPNVVYVNYDHTNEFSQQDISDNKVMAMLPYLMGTIGIIIALLASRESPYTYFHVRQAIKMTVTTILVSIVSLLLCWTFIIPIAGGLLGIFVWILHIIAFFQVCSGKAIEPVMIRSFKFFK